MRVRTLGHGNDLFHRRVRLAVGNVFKHRAGKQRRLLEHHTRGGAQLLHVQVRDLLAAHLKAATRDGVEAKQQVHNRGLAAAGLANQRDLLALTGGKRHIVQHRLTRHVLKGDVVECDDRFAHPQRCLLRRIERRHARSLRRSDQLAVRGRLDRLVHHLEVVARAGDGALRGIDDPAHHGHRLARHGHHLDEHDHLTNREMPIERAREQDQVNPQKDQVHGHAARGIHGVPPARLRPCDVHRVGVVAAELF